MQPHGANRMKPFSPRLAPFGRTFFLEAARPWDGEFDLTDASTMATLATYRNQC